MAMSAWLALIGGAALATASGIVTGWQANRLGMKRDKQEHEHQQRMARNALAQERLDRTYTELGIFLARRWAWARSVHPFMGAVATPDPIPDAELWRIETLVKNHGSPEVQELLDEWGKVVQKIENADAIIRLTDTSRAPSDELAQEAMQEKKAIEMEYRPEMLTAADAIRHQMNADLAGQTKVSGLCHSAHSHSAKGQAPRLCRCMPGQAPEDTAMSAPTAEKITQG
jgi:hypothetical protein